MSATFSWHRANHRPFISYSFFWAREKQKEKNKVFASSEMETRQEEDDDALGLWKKKHSATQGQQTKDEPQEIRFFPLSLSLSFRLATGIARSELSLPLYKEWWARLKAGMKKTRQKINGTTQAATFESHSVRAHSFAMDREKNNQLYTDRLFKHISDRERTNELKESDKIQIKQNRERKRERKKNDDSEQ